MSITNRSAASTDPIEQTVQFGRIAAAIEYLYDHAADQPTLAQVSQAVHVSPEYLQRQFQQWAGVSPKKMLQHISLERGRRRRSLGSRARSMRPGRAGSVARDACTMRSSPLRA
ncbi:AraC family transcriptional regulator [Rothia aeria]|uniref:AraC family transcriptional regulator n=1 Tax=Rothia aeria TaxID=172042 RepID=UPI000A56134F|nr:AraC family transcriptional regulator [Rothia aeria]